MNEVGSGLDAVVGVVKGSFSLRAGLAVEAGRTVAILGPNGAGKTTLLRALAGLEPLVAGRIVLDGDVLDDTARRTHRAPEDRPVGVVFQQPLLFPHLTAVDNVAFGLRCRRVRRSEARRQAAAWLERLGLGALAGAKPAELSGGQAQRVALARALATEPRLLLLDEPLASLDAGAKAEARRELRRHVAAQPGVRVLVTHDPVEAAALADRLVVLEDGRVVQEGTMSEISRWPRSRYVADLVGVNLLHGRGEGSTVRVGSFTLAVAEPTHGEVFAVVHPRAVSLHGAPPDGAPRNVWQARVESIDGHVDRVRVTTGGPVRLVAEITPTSVTALDLVEGGSVWVAVKATEIAVYEA